MSMTMTDVRAALDPDEVDYTSASRLGAEALPHLMTLVRDEGNPGMAAKAAYLAGLIQADQGDESLGADEAEGVVAAAAASADARVRVAAAAVASKLSPQSASRVLNDLVVDLDAGVQKHALRSVPEAASAELRSKVEHVSVHATDATLRGIAEEVMQGLR